MTAKDLFGCYSKAALRSFLAFHRENPEVFQEFRKLAFKMKRSGRKRYSAETIINVLRWDRDLKTTGDDFEINNNYRSFYARLLILKHPEFSGFFELRK